MTDTPYSYLPEEARTALLEVQRLNADLRIAQRRYLDALASDDPITQVAFRLYQKKVLSEEDWSEDEPVTWEHWWSLQIDSERDEWLALAADLIGFVREVDAPVISALEDLIDAIHDEMHLDPLPSHVLDHLRRACRTLGNESYSGYLSDWLAEWAARATRTAASRAPA